MKKKAIEQIPYLKLKQTSRKKDVKHIGVTAVKNISGSRHLFLEIYRNTKEGMEIPIVRVVLTKNDFGTYYPDKGVWDRKKIERDGEFTWWTGGGGYVRYEEKVKQNILQSEEDMQRIQKFCSKYKVWNKDKWWDYIYKYQDDITTKERVERERRKYERRQTALHDRMAHTEVLPEQEILKWSDEMIFNNEHLLFYKKHGSHVQIACSKCGGVTEVRWKPGISYESQFERTIGNPKEGHFGTCPMCGDRGKYKCQGKTYAYHRKRTHIFLGQKYKETGMVIRYVMVDKDWHLQEMEGEKGPEMYSSHEEISGTEIARAYFEPNKPVQIDYHKHSNWSGKDFWDDCNLSSNANIVIGNGRIMPETYSEMEGTILQYSALWEYVKEVGECNPIDFFKCYKEIPQTEMLVKLGMFKIIDSLIEDKNSLKVNILAARPDTFLGIRKEHVKQLMEKKGSVKLLEVMQVEKELEQNWTDTQVEYLAMTRLRQERIKLALQYMSVQRLLNRIEKYAGTRINNGCSNAINGIREVADTYIDYLSMRQQLGYDMTNTIYLFPHNLREAHDRMVLECNEEELDKRIREVLEKYPNISKEYRNVRNKYFYEDESYEIRPARSAKEIVIEGRVLHHCVGGNGYLAKHDKGETYILMLRKKDDLKIPYITVEIDGKTNRILQWYGMKDKKTDKEVIEPWLNEYLKLLRAGKIQEKQVLQVAG